MSEWRKVKLGEVADLGFGATPARGEPKFWTTEHTGLPWATIADMQSDPIVDTAERITDTAIRAGRGRLVRSGTPLISFKLTIGRVSRAGCDLYTNEAIASVIARPGIVDSNWLYHTLPSVASQGVTDSAVKGATLNKAKLLRLPIHLPPLAEQRRIAEILDTIDEVINAEARTVVKLRRHRTGLAAELLRTPTECQQQEGTLADYLSSIVDGPFGSRIKSYHYVRPPGVRVVRLANIGEGVFNADDEAFISQNYAGFLWRHEVRSGDVLVASLGDDNHRPGRACAYPSHIGSGIVKADCFRLRPKPSSVDTSYLVSRLNDYNLASELRRRARGVTRDRITLTQLRQLPFDVPALDEQRRIARILDAADEAIRAQEAHIQKTKRTQRGLAADLLSGRVRTVKDVESRI